MTPSRTQTSPSNNWFSYNAGVEVIVKGATGIMADAAGAFVFTQNGRTLTWNLLQGQTPPLRGDFVIDASNGILVHVAH